MTAKCTWIDFFPSTIPLSATHKRWSDFWDAVVAINDRGFSGQKTFPLFKGDNIAQLFVVDRICDRGGGDSACEANRSRVC